MDAGANIEIACRPLRGRLASSNRPGGAYIFHHMVGHYRNLRAVWKDENDAQVGLQFLDDGMVQYVIFARCAPEVEITPAYGRVSIDTAIIGQIEGFDLRPLVGA